MNRSILIVVLMTMGFTVKSQINSVPDSSSKKNESAVIANGAKLQLISSRFSFTEGPAADKNGNVYFTDQPNNKIWKYTTDGKLEIFLHNAGRSNGTYFDRQGNLVTCADEHNQLWSVDKDTNVTVLLKDFNGLHFNGPNDLWIDKKGGIYFTDPYYQRDYWTRQKADLPSQSVYYLAKNKLPVLVAGDLMKPNGIAGSADNKYLYVADIKADTTWRYNIGKHGRLFNKTLAAAKGSDGITIDSGGNLYLTGKGVFVYNRAGVLIEHIEVPEAWTANLVFAGKKKDILFITASKSLYSLQMKVHGVN